MKKLKIVGIFFVITGLAMLSGGGVVGSKAMDGMASLQAVYKAQGVTMTYDENGNFVDRGTKEAGDAILKLLTEDWKFPLNRKNLDPKDPLVNTPDELMATHARISYHVMHGTYKVVLDKDVEYKGEVFKAGTYDFSPNGKYWQGFDRNHPLEGPGRELAWTATAQGLLANLAAGTASHSLVQVVTFVGFLTMGLGLVFLLGGAGLVMASKKENI